MSGGLAIMALSGALVARDALAEAEETSQDAVVSGPTATMSAPANGAVLTIGTATTLTATVAGLSATQSAAVTIYVDDPATAAGTSLDTASPFSFSWTPTAAGTHTIWAVATITDTVGPTTTTVVAEPIVVTVKAANTAPAAVIIMPTATTPLVSGTPVRIWASVSDADGTIAKVEFYDGTTKIGEDTTAPFGISWTPTTAGSHTLTVKAFDDGGLSATSAAVTTTVTAPPNVPPTVTLTSPAAGDRVVGSNVPLKADALDTDGTVVKVEFYDGTTKVGEDATAPYSLSWTASGLGAHALTAKAIDNSGAITTSTVVTVNVVAVPPPTLVRAVNFGGRTLDVDGVRFESDGSRGIASGPFRLCNGPDLTSTLGAAKAELLRCFVWGYGDGTRRLRAKIENVSAGNYDVYPWVFEDSVSQTWSLVINGQTMASVTSGAAGTWQRLGPFRVTLASGGSITIESRGGDANLSAVEIYRV